MTIKAGHTNQQSSARQLVLGCTPPLMPTCSQCRPHPCSLIRPSLQIGTGAQIGQCAAQRSVGQRSPCACGRLILALIAVCAPSGKHHLPSAKLERLSSKNTQDRRQGQLMNKPAVKQGRSREAVGGGRGKTHSRSKPFAVFQDELAGSTPESIGSNGASKADVKLGPTVSLSGAAEHELANPTDTSNQVVLHRPRLVDDDASSGADDRTAQGTA